MAELDRERASEAATEWLILLQEEPGDADTMRRFNAWLSDNPLHAEAWAQTRHVSQLIAAVPPVHARRWRDGARLRRSAMAAAGMALAACLLIFVMPTLLLHLRADYTTGTGQIRTVTLEDGSTAVLAPGSALEVAYSARERRVRLLAGEAFFTVSHNAARPFRVAADGIDTTDLGTKFDVRRGGEGAVIAVSQGSVRVDYLNVSEHLREGEGVRVAWSGEAARLSRPVGQVAAWRQGRLIAQDEPMQEVVDQLRRYFRGAILVTDDALAARRVTGVYNLSDPREALSAIARAHGARVRQITPWLLVVSG